MTPEAYLDMANTEDRHWWFVARRSILRSVLEGLKLPEGATILEVGSGTGGNLEMLAGFGTVHAMEMDDNARHIGAQKTGGHFDIRAGYCPDGLPYSGATFDLICLFDVLEHIEQAPQSLAVLRDLLAPGGRMLVTVPAYQWMWSAHDEFLHHKRRYTAGMLRQQAQAASLEAERLTYFNTLLFPLAASMRMLDKVLGRKTASGNDVPSPAVNAMFRSIFAFERHLLNAINLPFGVSLLGVLRAKS